MIFIIDLTSEEAIYLQLRNQVVMGIARGELVPGELLPSVRDLAEELGINHMTVNKSYSILKQEGFLVSDRQRGTRVRECTHGDLDASYYEKLSVLIAEGLSRTKKPELFEKKILEILHSFQKTEEEKL